MSRAFSTGCWILKNNQAELVAGVLRSENLTTVINRSHDFRKRSSFALLFALAGLAPTALISAQATEDISRSETDLTSASLQLEANPETSVGEENLSTATLLNSSPSNESNSESPELTVAQVSEELSEDASSSNENSSPETGVTTLDLPEEETQTVSSQMDAPITSYSSILSSESMSQVTSVSQLSDVQPTDWAFQALQSLVERYGCIAGYPDSTFRGDRSLSRYEFAAGLNACLDRINELIAAGTATLADRQDLLTLQRLQEEFAAELAALRGRVDVLEARTAELEANQFSTTTKLFGQAVIGIQGRTDNEFQLGVDQFEDESEPNVITNLQLSLLTQFSPRSILLTGLQAGDGSTTTGDPALTTFFGLGYEGDTDHDFELSDLSYRHLFGDNFALIAGPAGVNAVNVFRGSNRVESAGFGPLSRFAQRNPIISIGAGRGGAGFDWQISDNFSLQAVYSASTPAENTDGGLFGGENGVTSVGAQLVISPARRFDIALQYVNSYSPFGRLFTGVGDDQVAVATGARFRAPIKTNAAGASVEWRVARPVTVGGWFGYTHSDLLGESGSVETTNWMAYLNFPDLFREGNLGGIYVGQPPRIVDSDLPVGRNIPAVLNLSDNGDGQPDAATHLEVFYRFRVNDNVTLTPGVMVIFNPGHNDANDTITVGGLRTTFSF